MCWFQRTKREWVNEEKEGEEERIIRKGTCAQFIILILEAEVFHALPVIFYAINIHFHLLLELFVNCWGNVEKGMSDEGKEQ